MFTNLCVKGSLAHYSEGIHEIMAWSEQTCTPDNGKHPDIYSTKRERRDSLNKKGSLVLCKKITYEIHAIYRQLTSKLQVNYIQTICQFLAKHIQNTYKLHASYTQVTCYPQKKNIKFT